MMSTVCTLISVVATRQWHLHQMEVTNAFRNDLLTKEIYMISPPDLPHPPHFVCRLHRALYGLK